MPLGCDLISPGSSFNSKPQFMSPDVCKDPYRYAHFVEEYLCNWIDDMSDWYLGEYDPDKRRRLKMKERFGYWFSKAMISEEEYSLLMKTADNDISSIVVYTERTSESYDDGLPASGYEYVVAYTRIDIYGHVITIVDDERPAFGISPY